jgi:hypothetical protein
MALSPGTSLVKEVVFQKVLQLVIARLIVALPFLALPIINPVFVWIATDLLGRFFDELAVVVEMQVIYFENDAKRIEYVKAVDEIKLAILKGTLDENTREYYRKKLSDLISFK